ncbi:hypothetical protein [Salinispora pacifica]|uniref:hypothetical protein n=1 Tax=Salinispora pacifica TaxID=351187 RepID=UPI0012F964FE|nr:hypothetical protein [Salinispora pacifica]
MLVVANGRFERNQTECQSHLMGLQLITRAARERWLAFLHPVNDWVDQNRTRLGLDISPRLFLADLRVVDCYAICVQARV